MTGISKDYSDIKIKIEIVEKNNLSNSSLSASKNTVFDTPVKAKLLDDEIRIMLQNGLDPQNPQDVKKWIEIPKDQKDEMQNNFYKELEQKKNSIQDKNNPQQIEKGLILPENWDKMSLKDKQNYILNKMGEYKYGDEWNSKSNKEKSQLIENDFESIMKIMEPQYYKMSRKDKKRAMEHIYLDLFAVIKDYKGQKLTIEEFTEAYNAYKNKSTTEKIIKKMEVHSELNIHNEPDSVNNIDKKHNVPATDELRQRDIDIKYGSVLKAFLAEKKLTNFSQLSNTQLLEYYEVLETHGLLNDYLKEQRDLTQYLIETLPASADETSAKPTKKLVETFGQDKLIFKTFLDEAGNEVQVLDQKKGFDSNSDVVSKPFLSILENNSPEEARNLILNEIKQYSGSEQTQIFRMLQAKLSKEQFEILFPQGSKISTPKIAAIYAHAASTNAHAIPENQNFATDLMFRLKQEQAEEGNQVNIEPYIRNAKETYATEQFAKINVTAAEYGYKEDLKLANEYAAQREDALDVFKISNNLIANSEKIADDIKQFYAQNSIEVLRTPEDRAAQAKDLGNYNNEYFDAGVKNGLENIKSESSSISKTSSNTADNQITQANNTKADYYVNVSQNDIDTQNTLTNIIEDDKKQVKLDLSSQEDCNKLVAFFEKYPTEMAKYIATTSHRNKEDVLIALCNSSKTAALAFFKSNPSLGAIILNCSKIDLATQTDIALIMVKNCPKGSDDWNVAMKYLGKYYKQDDKENSNEKSISFKA